MRAIVLAAGQGTRLRPLTDEVPKCLVPVRGVAMLDRLLTNLRAVGVDDVIVVSGYRADRLATRGLHLRHNAQFATTNMVASLACAADAFDDDILLVYGDIVVAPWVFTRLLEADGELCIGVNTRWRELWEQRMPDPLADAETLRMRDGCVVELGKKPRSYAEIEGQYMGLVKWRRSVGARIAAAAATDEARDMYMTSLLQQLIDDGAQAHAVLIEGGWLEVDSLEDLAVANGASPYVDAVFS